MLGSLVNRYNNTIKVDQLVNISNLFRGDIQFALIGRRSYDKSCNYQQFYWKSLQITFLKRLLIIKGEQSHIGGNIKIWKINEFSQSSNISICT